MDLRFRQFECFLILAETLNFGRAAKQLRTSQPALSFQIKSMESEIGIQLFMRDKRHVSLTDAGRKLVVVATSVLNEIRGYEESIRALSQSRDLRVFCGPAGEQHFLPAMLRTLSKQAPGWNIELCGIPPIEHVGALRENRVDLLLMIRRIDAPGITFVPIFDEPWYAVVPLNSEFAKREKISVSDFCRKPIVVTGRRYSDKSAPQLLDMMEPFGLEPTLIEAPPSPSSRFALVAAGQGHSFCTGLLPPAPNVAVKAIPFEETFPPLQRGAAWRTGFDPICLSVIKKSLLEVLSASPARLVPRYIRPDALAALSN